MTHLCEVITFRPRNAALQSEHQRRPNLEALRHLGNAEDLVAAISGDIEAGTENAAAGTSTFGLGGLSKGRTLGWSVRLTLELAALTNDPRDRQLATVLQQWLDEKGATNG
ncbi:MAG: hypothetical protein ACK4SQ_16180 [Allorhizobium sp.]